MLVVLDLLDPPDSGDLSPGHKLFTRSQLRWATWWINGIHLVQKYLLQDTAGHILQGSRTYTADWQSSVASTSLQAIQWIHCRKIHPPTAVAPCNIHINAVVMRPWSGLWLLAYGFVGLLTCWFVTIIRVSDAISLVATLVGTLCMKEQREKVWGAEAPPKIIVKCLQNTYWMFLTVLHTYFHLSWFCFIKYQFIHAQRNQLT